MKIKTIIIIGITFFFYACNKQKIKLEIPKNITIKKDSLHEELIKHYSESPDSLKLQAVDFLLKNSQYHTHYEGERIKKYSQAIENMLPQPVAQLHDLKELLKDPNMDTDKIVSDIPQLSSEALTSHIDTILDFYKKTTWKNKISKKIINNYLLPYNIDKESISPWASFYRKKFFKENNTDILNKDIEEAIAIAHQWIYKSTLGYRLTWGSSSDNVFIPELTPITLDKLKTGTCDQLSVRGAAIMRSLGIPTAIDFTPIHLNIASGHSWNAAVINENKSIPFDATTGKLHVYKRNSHKISKVYRKSFSLQKDNHFFYKGNCSYLPDYFNSLFNIDVTQLYTKVSDIEIPIINRFSVKSEVAYLSVFTNRTWKPIDWGITTKKTAKFKNIGRDGVYLSSLIEPEGIGYLNAPFLLDSIGIIRYLIPDTANTQKLKLTRKYPLSDEKKTYLSRMIGGLFQGANKPDFSDAITIAKIDKNPGEYLNTINITAPQEKFRYVRYYAPAESYGNVAEIEFYSPSSSEKLKGKIQNDDDYGEDNNTSKYAAFDGKLSTYVDIPLSEVNSWIGLDLEKETTINEIRFSGRKHFSYRMEGGFFEGANTPDFSDAITIGSIKKNMSTLMVSQQQKFRYVRYSAAPNSYGNIAEIEFYSPSSSKKLKGKVLGTDGSWEKNGQTSKHAAFDGKSSTYVDIPDEGYIWVGLDLEKQTTIDKIRFLPRIDYLDRMMGGVFEGANKPDFSDATTIATISENLKEYMNKLMVTHQEKFRYIRYFAPPASYVNISEIEFYSPSSSKKLKGKVLGTDGSWEKNEQTGKHAAFDGKSLTYVDIYSKEKLSVGLDLGEQKYINKICFLARNDMNSIQKGNEYELFYWNNGWVSMGRKKPKSTELIYDNVPSNALYWLRNHTEGKEERIFTYENGEQVWW